MLESQQVEEVVRQVMAKTQRRRYEAPSILVDKVRLDALLKARKMTAIDLAQRMDCYLGTVHRIKATGRLTLPFLERMSDALQCHPFDLLVCKGFVDPILPRSGEPLVRAPQDE